MKKWMMRFVMVVTISCMLGPVVFAEGADGTGSKSDFDRIQRIQKEAEDELERELGAFEITANQRELAKENEAGYPVLDAGRGNPNWINTQSRYAFTRFMNFSIEECENDFSQGNMAGHAQSEGIGERFDAAMNPRDSTDAFLIEAVKYCTETLGLDKDALLKELADAVIGDYYPSPSRCLPNTEVILNAYLQSTLYKGVDLAAETQIFPTEGGSAAMVYIFEALGHNRLLKKGDQIAIATPIFTPYMQIPSVKDYGLVSIDISSTEEENWDIPEEELVKLEDPAVKAFFLVNPSNPASHALSEGTLRRLQQVVKKNPDLIILTDDVYGTFVKDFQTVYSVMPYNTILVYSFSKLYGVTGWRVGLIAMNKDNICDDLLAELPEEDRDFLRKEYAIVSSEPEDLPFLDRVVADSRSIGLYHTSGLSTPSQVYMDLMALTHLVYAEEDPYIRLANETVKERYLALMDALGLPADEGTQNASYYTLLDVLSLSGSRYGGDFAGWLSESRTEIDFLNDLAKKKGVVLMYGPGFSAPEGTVRISLANLNKEDYVELARRLFELLEEYYEEYEAETALDNAA
ncbi:MAG: bifunctional aspartate transaminase/aspartate 4-decarboxylase [Eubacteriales bacterium]|nr:bifunctional aspartate transaminase/aspartate 4-decarboxylase [Eubacteriales bacterium]